MGITFTGGISAVGPITAGPVVVPFTANAVNFDSSDILKRSTQLDGTDNDGSKLMLSFWFRLQGGDGTFRDLFAGANGNIEIRFNSDNTLTVELRNPWRFTTTTVKFSTTDNPGWNHIIISSDASAAVNKFQIRHNDVDIFSDVFSNIGPTSPSAYKFALASHSLGAALSLGVQPLRGDLAEFWWGADFLDLDVEANRRKFRDANGKPVDLGLDGSTPNSVIPVVYFRGDAATWNAGTNAGSGGDFTMTGEVTDVVDGPGD